MYYQAEYDPHLQWKQEYPESRYIWEFPIQNENMYIFVSTEWHISAAATKKWQQEKTVEKSMQYVYNTSQNSSLITIY